MRQTADIYSRSHQAAVDILKNLEVITATVGDSLREMELQIELLAATQGFTSEAREDIAEAISRFRELPANLRPVIEQLSTDLDVISRGLGESAGLARQTRGRLSSADEYLHDVTEQAQEQANMAANIATLKDGQEYLFTSKEALRRVIRLAGAKAVKDILEETE